MKRLVPVLVTTVGLGCCFSCKSSTKLTTQSMTTSKPASPATPVIRATAAQPSKELNPFDRYLADTANSVFETPLENFAASCGLDLSSATGRFAQRPDEKWALVPNLKDALKDQETDFYGTLAVYHASDKTVAVEWGMELDTGDYYRLLYCLDRDQIVAVESTSWTLDLSAPQGVTRGRGYDHRWNRSANGKFITTSKGFVDLRDQPIGASSVNAEARKELDRPRAKVEQRTWQDLKYPDGLRN